MRERYSSNTLRDSEVNTEGTFCVVDCVEDVGGVVGGG